MMKPMSWFVVTFAFGASVSFQALARILKNSSPVAS